MLSINSSRIGRDRRDREAHTQGGLVVRPLLESERVRPLSDIREPAASGERKARAEEDRLRELGPSCVETG